MTRGAFQPKTRASSCYIGFALFTALLGAVVYLFYFRGYVSVLSGDSSSFLIELARTQARVHPDADVLVLGNSAAGEGFLANYFNARAPGHVALNFGIPGGSVYLFDRMAAMAAEEGVRPRSIVLILTPEILSERTTFNFMRNDLTLLKTVLGARDLATLSIYSRDFREYGDLAVPIVVRPILFRAELRDFFAHPAERVADARKIHEWLGGFRHDSPMLESDHGFAVCDAGPLDRLPATLERLRRENSPIAADVDRVKRGYDALDRQPLAVEAFHVERLRRLLLRLAGTRAAVFIAEAPYYDPGFSQYSSGYRSDFASALRGVAQSVPGVTLLAPFETDCTLMMDTLHLNRKGGEQFTEYLRTRVL